MNPAHLHIILNYIPVVGVPIGFALLIYGVWRKSIEVKRASLLVFVVIGLITIPTFLAGKAAEDVVEHLPGVSDDVIETHEAAALIALLATQALGTVSLLALLWSWRSGTIAGSITVLMILFSGGSLRLARTHC